jgi:hypothetical protein
VKNSTSDLLIENCDEFIFYEDLVRGQLQPAMPQIAGVPEKLQEAFGLLVDSILALQRENKEILWGSMVKETMKRKKPSFNETYYGFRTFSHLLEDAQRRGLVGLRRDQKSGSYIVEDLGPAASTGITSTAITGPGASQPVAAAESDANGARRGRRRGRGRRARVAYPGAPGAAADLDDADEGDEADGTNGHDDVHASSTPAAPARSAEPERTTFSFLSWLRRESSPSRSEPQESAPKRDDES